MQPCPICEGRKITGRLSRADIDLLAPGGKRIQVIDVTDQPCGACAGSGEVAEEQMAKLTNQPCASRIAAA